MLRLLCILLDRSLRNVFYFPLEARVSLYQFVYFYFLLLDFCLEALNPGLEREDLRVFLNLLGVALYLLSQFPNQLVVCLHFELHLRHVVLHFLTLQ